MNYGKRICLVCEAEFTAAYSSQVTCGAKCKIIRIRYLNRLRTFRKRSRRYDDLQWCNERLEDCLNVGAEKENVRIRKNMNALAQELKIVQDELDLLKKRQATAQVVAKRQQAEKKTASGKQPKERQVKKDALTKPDEASKKTYRNICARCGSTFKSENPDQKFCSEMCAEESAALAI